MKSIHNALSHTCIFAAMLVMACTASCGGDSMSELIIPPAPNTKWLDIDQTSVTIQTTAAFTMAAGTTVAFSWEKLASGDSWDKGFFTFSIPEQLYGKKYTFGSGGETFKEMKPSVSYKADKDTPAISATDGDGEIEGTIEYKAINLTFLPLTSVSVSFYVTYDITFAGKHFEGGYKGAVQRTVKTPGEGVALHPFTEGYLADTKDPTPKPPTNSVTIGKKTFSQQELRPKFLNDKAEMLQIDLGELGMIVFPTALQEHTIDLTKYYAPFTHADHNWSISFGTDETTLAISGDEDTEKRPIKSGYLYVSPTKEGKLDLAFAIVLSNDSPIKGNLTGIAKSAK